MNLLNADLVEASCKDGFDTRLVSQPPNSLDMNELDLGFFLERLNRCNIKRLPLRLTNLLMPWRNLLRFIVREPISSLFNITILHDRGDEGSWWDQLQGARYWKIQFD